MGRVVGGEVVKIAGKAVPISDDKLLFETYDITIPSNKENDRIDEAREIIRIDDEGRSSELPYKKMELTTILAEARRIEELYNGPDSFDYKLFAIRLGDLVFAGLPGECFVEIGRRIESESPFDHTVICCLTNGGATYFPSSSAYAEGGYEAKTSRLQKGADNIVISGMKSLFDSIR